MEYTGFCSVCGKEYAKMPPFRSTLVHDGKGGRMRRVETCPACACVWWRNCQYGDFSFERPNPPRSKHRTKIPELVKARLEGAGINELSKRFGMHRTLVHRWLRKYNLSRMEDIPRRASKAQ